MKEAMLKQEFVEFIPNSLEKGVLYISMNYATAAHNCCCGCGNKVVTPLTPTDWMLIYDGENISLSPSIGNWSFPCKSHYWIKRGRVKWAGQWSSEEISAGRKKDQLAKEKRYGRVSAILPEDTVTNPEVFVPKEPVKRGFWRQIWVKLTS